MWCVNNVARSLFAVTASRCRTALRLPPAAPSSMRRKRDGHRRDCSDFAPGFGGRISARKPGTKAVAPTVRATPFVLGFRVDIRSRKATTTRSLHGMLLRALNVALEMRGRNWVRAARTQKWCSPHHRAVTGRFLNPEAGSSLSLTRCAHPVVRSGLMTTDTSSACCMRTRSQ